MGRAVVAARRLLDPQLSGIQAAEWPDGRRPFAPAAAAPSPRRVAAESAALPPCVRRCSPARTAWYSSGAAHVPPFAPSDPYWTDRRGVAASSPANPPAAART